MWECAVSVLNQGNRGLTPFIASGESPVSEALPVIRLQGKGQGQVNTPHFEASSIQEAVWEAHPGKVIDWCMQWFCNKENGNIKLFVYISWKIPHCGGTGKKLNPFRSKTSSPGGVCPAAILGIYYIKYLKWNKEFNITSHEKVVTMIIQSQGHSCMWCYELWDSVEIKQPYFEI